MLKPIAASILAITTFAGLPACSTAPKSQADRDILHSDSQTAIDRMARTDASIKDFIARSYGFAVFPTVGKGAAGVGGAYGRGEVYEDGAMIGFCDLSQATIGFQLGGQSYTELICFENKAALDRFTSGQFAFAAQASAVALKSGSAANAKYTDGVAVFTSDQAGLMYEASIGGQKFSFQRR